MFQKFSSNTVEQDKNLHNGPAIHQYTLINRILDSSFSCRKLNSVHENDVDFQVTYNTPANKNDEPVSADRR